LKSVSTNINDKEINKAYIYPNPVNEKLTFIWPGKEPGSLKINIYNLHGKLVQSILNIQSYNKIDVSYLAGGIYWIIIESETNRIKQKFVKL
ncbi:MAG: T9SS type A sorting domain-containing protein, partial [Draconibacterium sp.]|nr:T9SS type A sorting domain-containing protein [Draconibacterium sp.]